MEAAEPTSLGRYKILGELGKGGHATVYRAIDTTLDREVALKVLHPMLLSDPTFTQRFRREAKALASLRHRNIIVIHEVGEAEGRMFIVMELAKGPSLAQFITGRGQIAWDETLAILKQICEALYYAHMQNIIHRDLKPSNILLDQDRGVLLSDFGLARLVGTGGSSATMTQGILGTPAYIAPEIWDMEVSTPQADIYALGCIVYEMLTGKTLFTGETPMQILRAHDKGPHFPAQWGPDVPAGVDEVLAKAMARLPENRYADAMSLWHALDNLHTANQAARVENERQAAARNWRAQAEEAIRRQDWRAAKDVVDRWLAEMPDDRAAQTLSRQIERTAGNKGTAQPTLEKQAADVFNQDRGTPPPNPESRVPFWKKYGVLALLGGFLLACIALVIIVASINWNQISKVFGGPTQVAVAPTVTMAERSGDIVILETETNTFFPTRTQAPTSQPTRTLTATWAPSPTYTISPLDPLGFLKDYYELIAKDRCKDAYALLSDNYKNTFPEKDRYAQYEDWCINISGVEFVEQEILYADKTSAVVIVQLHWTQNRGAAFDTKPMRIGLVLAPSGDHWLIESSQYE